VGNLMTFSYCCGLTLGSLLSYGLDAMLGSGALPCFPTYNVRFYVNRYICHLLLSIILRFAFSRFNIQPETSWMAVNNLTVGMT
jgi:hypothetical protein